MATENVDKSKEPISKDREEEMSSALIAQLLAEDGMSHGNEDYYAEYSARGYDPYQTHRELDDSYEENSEDDFDPKKKKYIPKKEPAKRGRKRKAPVPTVTKSNKKLDKEDITEEKNSTEEEKHAAPEDQETNTAEKLKKPKAEKVPKEKPVKKPKKPVLEGMNSGIYNDQEEKSFLEGLELYGRDWTKVQQAVATRDANSIRSHAQKHFIKMYRDQTPLPDKVRESGDGYTLSGKPLDPNSAAARPYLCRNGSITIPGQPKAILKEKETKVIEKQEESKVTEKEEESKVTPKEEETQVTEKVEELKDDPMEDVQKDQAAQQPEEEKSKTEEPVESMEIDSAIQTVEKQTKELSVGEDDKQKVEEKKPKKKSNSKPSTPSPSTSSTTSESYDIKGRTNYSTSRLRKQRDMISVNYGQINGNEDPLTLIKCEPFAGKPGSNVNGSQPFELSVDSNVMLAMDFHAHLMTTEIIGFLAGEWDKENMRLIVREAFPCRSIETGQNDVNVEMDPTSAIETRQAIEEKNMKVVGWYHSHPTFIPDPSLVDIQNQRNYQVLCRDNHHHQDMGQITMEPFVGAIVSPYDPALPGSSSVVNWFHVSNTNSDRPLPKKLIYDLTDNVELSQEISDRLFGLLTMYKESKEKTDLNEHWRQDATETKLQKMIRSLASRMPWVQKQLQSEEQQPSLEDAFLNKVQISLKDW